MTDSIRSVLSCLCHLGERSSTSELGHRGGVSSQNDVYQPFRPPRSVDMGGTDQRSATAGNIDQRSGGMGSVGEIRPPSSQPATTSTAARGVVEGVSQKTSDKVPSSRGTTASGPLRQLQLTDCSSLPARVQQQLYLGEKPPPPSLFHSLCCHVGHRIVTCHRNTLLSIKICCFLPPT